MAGRRKTAAALEAEAFTVDHRPPAPDDLNEFETDLWDKVIASKPVEWFAEDTQFHLKCYCELAYEVKCLNIRIKDMHGLQAEISELKQATTLRDSVLAKMLAIARSCRLTQQSQYEGAKARRHNNGGGKPSWVRD